MALRTTATAAAARVTAWWRSLRTRAPASAAVWRTAPSVRIEGGGTREASVASACGTCWSGWLAERASSGCLTDCVHPKWLPACAGNSDASKCTECTSGFYLDQATGTCVKVMNSQLKSRLGLWMQLGNYRISRFKPRHTLAGPMVPHEFGLPTAPHPAGHSTASHPQPHRCSALRAARTASRAAAAWGASPGWAW